MKKIKMGYGNDKCLERIREEIKCIKARVKQRKRREKIEKETGRWGNGNERMGGNV